MHVFSAHKLTCTLYHKCGMNSSYLMPFHSWSVFWYNDLTNESIFLLHSSKSNYKYQVHSCLSPIWPGNTTSWPFYTNLFSFSFAIWKLSKAEFLSQTFFCQVLWSFEWNSQSDLLMFTRFSDSFRPSLECFFGLWPGCFSWASSPYKSCLGILMSFIWATWPLQHNLYLRIVSLLHHWHMF